MPDLDVSLESYQYQILAAIINYLLLETRVRSEAFVELTFEEKVSAN